MDELKKLYQARAILATTASGVPRDLQKRIAIEEDRVIHNRLGDFYDAANNFLNGIETPLYVTVISDPKAGVVVNIDPISPVPQKTDPVVSVESGFVQYLNELDISISSIELYKKALDDDLIVRLLRDYANVCSLEKVTDLDIIDKIIERVPTKRYKGGFPHAMLGHYRKFILSTGKDEPKEDA